jgi:hypothetical protein
MALHGRQWRRFEGPPFLPAFFDKSSIGGASGMHEHLIGQLWTHGLPYNVQGRLRQSHFLQRLSRIPLYTLVTATDQSSVSFHTDRIVKKRTA